MAIQTVPSEKTRVQLDLSANEIARLNWVMEVCDLSTRKELFSNALTLFEWAVKESINERKVASLDDRSGDRFFLSMPALSNAAGYADRNTETVDAETGIFDQDVLVEPVPVAATAAA